MVESKACSCLRSDMNWNVGQEKKRALTQTFYVQKSNWKVQTDKRNNERSQCAFHQIHTMAYYYVWAGISRTLKFCCEEIYNELTRA